MTLHSDRFDHEGDTRVDEWTRADYARMVQAVDDARSELRAAAHAAGHKIAMANKAFIDTFNRRTPNFPLEIDEAIAGAAECVDEAFAVLLNNGEIEALRRIAKTGRDER